jgi:hypothetical protein
VTDLPAIEHEITAGLAGMREQMGIPQPSNVVPFPVIRYPLSPARDVTGRLADSILAIEALADVMATMAREVEARNVERAKLIEMLRTGERAARQAAERLEN